MKTALLSLIICCGIILLSGCSQWEKWEAAFTPEQSENPSSDAPDEFVFDGLKPEPLLAPGEYKLNAHETGNSFILWVPYNYAPDYAWPVIFCYHGAGGKVTTWPFQQVTSGRDYIIVGMNYTPLINGTRNKQWISNEREFFMEALAMVSTRLNIDPEMIFMGGYSQGGYHTTLLGEEMLDRLAGLIILGAGRFFIDHTPPPKSKIRDKPVFIGVGENDTVHNPRAKQAAMNYERWGAKVTFEEWPGVGHGIRTPVFPSKLLLNWLEEIFSGSEK